MDPVLARIRDELFYGIGDYTKNQPDFVVDHFDLVGPREARRLLTEVRADLEGTDEVLIYVHLPFCFSTCVFCNSFPLRAGDRAMRRYHEALLGEFELLAAAGLLAGKRARCIYFGGGTPTAFTDADFAAILAGIRRMVTVPADCHLCTEAHPATLHGTGRLARLADQGFARVSVGCQTFAPEVLARCRREHDEERIADVVAAAHAHGLGVNLDMMLGLPGQTPADLERDLDVLDRIGPDAIEYIRHEVVNPAAIALYRAQPELLTPDDELFAMVRRSQEWLAARGYEMNGRYTGDRFWKYRWHWLAEMPIVASGLRARSYTRTLQYDSHEDLDAYADLINAGIPPLARINRLGPDERMYRSLFLALQTVPGLDVARFGERYGVDPRQRFADLLAGLVDLGCLHVDAAAIRLTPLGATFVEDVCDRILDTAVRGDTRAGKRMPHSAGNYTERLDG